MRVVKWSALAAAVVVTVSLGAAPAPQAPAAAGRGAANPQLDQYKRNVGLEVDAMSENIQKMERLGLQLRRARLPGVRDVEVPDRHPASRTASRSQHGVAGIPTAWIATWGSGKPVIALGSDIDDIPQASQKPGVAYHDPIIEGAPGHGEGHNSGHAAEDHRGARGEEGHGAQHLPGHADALARRRRGARRHQGVLRARRASSRTSTSRSSRTSATTSASAGATATRTASCRSSTASRARARTRPRRRGAAARRSTPSS